MKVSLLLLGFAFFILSCKKTETQDNGAYNDSVMMSNDTIADTLPAVPADTAATVQDSINRMNTANNNQADSTRR
jgi:hypothetical protein